MITFENGLDIRTRQQGAPTIARLHVGDGVYAFVVIGTQYGHIHTSGGDVRTWRSQSGARRFLRGYSPL